MVCKNSESHRRSFQKISKKAKRIGDILSRWFRSPKNAKKALKIFKGAAIAGDGLSCYFLAKMYEQQKFPDYVQAFEFYSRAQKKGIASAKLKLAQLYEKGLGTPKDTTKAKRLYSQIEWSEDAFVLKQLANMWFEKKTVSSYKKALKIYNRIVIQKDDPEVMHKMVYIYMKTRMRDLKKAFRWSKKSAELGYIPAMSTLAFLYSSNEIGIDYIKSLYWHQKAAKKGYLASMRALAERYYKGIGGVRKNNKKAASWYKKVFAKTNDIEIAKIMAKLYRGLNKKEAIDWYKKVFAKTNDIEVAAMIARVYRRLDKKEAVFWYKKVFTKTNKIEFAMAIANVYRGLDKKKAVFWYKKVYTRTKSAQLIITIAKTYREAKMFDKAIEWFIKSFELGNEEAAIKIRNTYVSGKMGKKYYYQAFQWYKKTPGNLKGFKRFRKSCLRASKEGDIRATKALASIYYFGFGLPKKRYAKALELFKKASQNDPFVMTRLGNMYLEGVGTQINYREAQKWFEKAAQLEDARAMRSLGFMYSLARGVKQDYKKARSWFEKAAQKGDVKSIKQLAIIHLGGKGVKKDIKKAKEYLKKAAIRGDKGAMLLLKSLEE